MDSQIRAAISAGMESICFTEHVDLDSPYLNAPGGADNPENVFRLDYERYREMYLVEKVKYAGRIRLFFGLEMGLNAAYAAQIEAYVKEHPDFDFVIGSTHSSRGMDPYYDSFFEDGENACANSGTADEKKATDTESAMRLTQSRDAERFDPYRKYFEDALCNVHTFTCFDSYGHLDYVLRYGPGKADGSSRERTSTWYYEKYADLIDKILFELILNGKALEINTSALKKGFPETNPGRAVLKKFHDFGGQLVTVGADAHTPDGVAYGFDRAEAVLKECGFTSYATFEGRKPVLHPL